MVDLTYHMCLHRTGVNIVLQHQPNKGIVPQLFWPVALIASSKETHPT